jgi:hypothetical protein
MAAQTYSIQSPSHAPAAAITVQAPGGTTGDLAPTGSGVALFVSNGATPTTVTLVPQPFDGLVVGTRTITIAAASQYLIPLPASVYGAGLVAVGYGNITTLTGATGFGVAVVTIPGS